MSKPTPAPLNLIPDAPIDRAGLDRLDRMNFVRSFTEAVRAVEGTDSVVLALAGPWGSGKSSLLNLVGGELQREAPDAQPLVVRFNPWWFSGTGRLVTAFVQQLGAAVSRPEVRDSLGAAAILLERLAAAIETPGEGLAGGDPADRDIEMLRSQLNAIFRNSRRRVLIFMDDIDRLSPEEMTQLLLIVRAVADFPNTTYIMAFDHEVVSQAIANKLGVDGRTYLEKVVLLQIDVPMPGRMTLERMVIGQLEAIDSTARSLDAEAQRQFRTLFESGVKHFLATPRACTRLLNVIRFTYPTLAGHVYFSDMLGVSCLMSFSSQAIQAIRTYSEAFVGHCDTSGKGWSQIRHYHKSWLSRISDRDRASVEAIVRVLFPKVAWALNGPLRGEEWIEVWDRQKRICSAQHFDAYFRLGLSSGEASEHQWQNVVELLEEATAFARGLQRFGPLDDGQAARWIDELLTKAADFVNGLANPGQAQRLFRAIMRRGDQIAAVEQVESGESGGRLRIHHIHRVVSVLVDCLLRIEDPRERLETLSAAVREDAGLLTAAELLDALDYRADIFADESDRPSPEANTAKLVEVLKLLDRRIQEAGQSGALASHPLFLKIVQKWWKFGRRAMSSNWIREASRTDELFVKATQQLCPRSADGKRAADTATLEFFVDILGHPEVRDRCQRLLEDSPEWLDSDAETALEQLAERLE